VKVVLRIQRQDSAALPDTLRSEDFEVNAAVGDSVATALFAIAARPVTTDGARVSPVAFESACRGSACSACMLLVNGHVRSACRTELLRVRPKRGPVVLAPMSKLPLVRDLIVDRSRLRTLRARFAERPSTAADQRPLLPRAMSELDRCTECGACYEACPETRGARFVGPAALHEARLALEVADGDARSALLDAATSTGGISTCSGARVCVEVCPEKLPLVESLLLLNRESTRHWLRTLLRR
jgi:succinate dehydrogenase / fumarate reductase iron-sulfur subunit